MLDHLELYLVLYVMLSGVAWATGLLVLPAKKKRTILTNHVAYRRLLCTLFLIVLVVALMLCILFPASAVVLALYLPGACLVVKIIVQKTVAKKIGFQFMFDTSNAKAPFFWYAFSLYLCVLVSLLSLYMYPHIPDSIQTFWNAGMQADLWEDKTIWGALRIPAIFSSCVAMLFLLQLLMTRLRLMAKTDQVAAATISCHKSFKCLQGYTFSFIAYLFSIMLVVVQPMRLMLIDLPDLPVQILLAVMIVVVLILLFTLRSYVGLAGCKLNMEITDQKDDRIGSYLRILKILFIVFTAILHLLWLFVYLAIVYT